MLIQQLRKHFPARFPEWTNSGIMASWGAYVVLHPEIFEQPATRAVLSGLAELTWFGYPPASFWGLITLLVGVIRACALFINGAYSRTPMIRLATSAASAFVWAQIVIGLWKTGIPNVGLVVYSGLVVIDIVSAYRAGLDTAVAEGERRLSAGTRTNNRGGSNRDSNSRLVV